MSGANKVILLGHLGADPETRYTQGGQPVANFSLATTEAWPENQMRLMVRHRSGWRCAGSAQMVDLGVRGLQICLAVDPALPENHAVMTTSDGRRTLAVWDGHRVKVPGKPDLEVAGCVGDMIRSD